MPRITISDLDDETLDSLRIESQRRGMDLGSAAAALIRERLIETGAIGRDSGDLTRLAGTWTDEDLAAFEASVSAFESIDAELWK